MRYRRCCAGPSPFPDGRSRATGDPPEGIQYGTQVTSTDGGRGQEPLDPDFAGLFRQEDLVAEPADDEPHFEPIVDPVVDPRDEDALHVEEPQPAAPAMPEPAVDTGRLFRSQGVAGHDEAVLALGSDHSGRLKTLNRRDGDTPPPATPMVVPIVPDAGPLLLDDAPDDHGQAPMEAAATSEAGSRRRGMSGSHRARSITGGAVYIIVIGVTVLVGFVNALIAGGDIGWPTGLALLISSVYAALTVRREDDTVAMIIPPIAFFLAAITAGQVFLDSLEGSLINRAAVLFFTLADNWVWIIGSTVAAFAIVFVRRRRRA